jgi:hypothetical protein
MVVIEICMNEFMTGYFPEVMPILNPECRHHTGFARNQAKPLYPPVCFSADAARDVFMSQTNINIVVLSLGR